MSNPGKTVDRAEVEVETVKTALLEKLVPDRDLIALRWI